MTLVIFYFSFLLTDSQLQMLMNLLTNRYLFLQCCSCCLPKTTFTASFEILNMCLFPAAYFYYQQKSRDLFLQDLMAKKLSVFILVSLKTFMKVIKHIPFLQRRKKKMFISVQSVRQRKLEAGVWPLQRVSSCIMFYI